MAQVKELLSFIPSASQISLLNNPLTIHNPVNMGVHRVSPHDNEDMGTLLQI